MRPMLVGRMTMDAINRITNWVVDVSVPSDGQWITEWELGIIVIAIIIYGNWLTSRKRDE